ncbi:MAG: dihydroorotate dehydrogenase (quinone), partial [Burkholderiales bacterium]
MFPFPYALARPLLFAIDPERAHDLTLASLDALAATGALRVVAGARVDDPVELLGLRLANRVGLAAGLDKNGAHVDALAQLGFGFVEVGTVTPKPQPGNPKPRMFRLPEADALINRMGFNNLGLDAFVANVQRRRSDLPLGLNIGKNAATPIERATDDYVEGLRRVWPHASYVTVNISSPNTKNLRQLQGGEAVVDYFNRRLFQPLGIGSIRWGSNFQDGRPQLSGGAYVTARDWAKFGDFIRRTMDGSWDGPALLPAVPST